MNKLNELTSITALVKEILVCDEKARNSDDYLYFCVLNLFAYKNNIDISRMTTPYFFKNKAELGFPPFESVRRARQKVQAKFPELSADEVVKGYRKENEAIVKAYAVSDV